jgi:polyisoprenoid-binding protein YceI
MAYQTEISFFSKTPVEDISATNKNVSSVLNTANNQVVFKVPISGFKFQNSLMEEHFNENYMETAKYPFSEFKGKINETIDYNKNGSYDVTVTGKIYIHGVEQDRTYSGKLTVNNDKIIVDAKIDIPLKDYNIEVPKLVVKNIAEVIPTTIHAEYKPYQKK